MFSTYPMILFFSYYAHQNTPSICTCSSPSVNIYKHFWPYVKKFASSLSREILIRQVYAGVCVFGVKSSAAGRFEFHLECFFAGCQCDAEPTSSTAVSVFKINEWINEKKTLFRILHVAECVSLFLSMSGMMSNAVGGPAAGVGGLSDISSLIEAWVLSNQNPKCRFDLRNWWMILGGREKESWMFFCFFFTGELFVQSCSYILACVYVCI